MEIIQENNGSYSIEVQGLERSKEVNYQELCIYLERKLVPYDWYWSISYTYAMYRTNEKFLFPKFYRTVFK